MYPGWLIAPDEVRSRIVDRLQGWVLHSIHERAGLSPLEQLEIFDELNWRFEVAQSPVWNELRPVYEELLSAINPFPNELTDLPATAISPRSPIDSKPNWATVQTRWLNLAFAMIRFYREERLDEPFELWHARASRLPLDSDAKARLSYERCLHALAHLNDDAVAAALNAWPTSTQDPFWSVRKASLLAELGRYEEATPVVRNALNTLRCGLTDTGANVFSLSREGWALQLMRWVYQAESFARGKFPDATRESHTERFRQLRPFGADPSELTDWFTSRLEAPPPTPEPVSVVRFGFEPGTATHSTQSSDGLRDRLFPAYQYLRFTEEAGIPPAFPSMILSRGSHLSAARWFAETDPPRTQSLLFRTLEEKSLDSYFSRSRVAALPQPLADQWRADALRAANAAIPHCGTGSETRNPVQQRAMRRLESSVTLVARLAIRASVSERERLWEFTRTLTTLPAVRARGADTLALRSLLQALSIAATADEVTTQLPRLFEMPLPGEPGSEVARGESWPDPPLIVGFELRKKQIEFTAEQFAHGRRRAVAALKSADVHVRRAALWRCDLLQEFALLSEVEEKALAKAFWAPTQKKHTLPWDAWGPATLHLALSKTAPAGPSAQARVKSELLGEQLGEVRGGFVRPARFFERVLDATGFHNAPRDSRRAYVVWTASDRKTLFTKVREWWEKHGRDAVAKRQEPRLFDNWDTGALAQFMRGLWNMVREVLLPRTPRGSRFGNEIVAFVEDVRSQGVPVGSVLPATLFVRPSGDVKVVASAVRREFTHTGVEFYLSALRGLNHWAELSHPLRGKRSGFPTIPADLLREIGTTVAARRPGVLRLTLQASVFILKRLKKTSDRKFRDSLLDGLDYLFTEAAYSERVSGTGNIKYEEIPSTRVEAVELAKCLSELGDSSHEVVRRWLEAASTDPLPEVRRAAEMKLSTPED